MPRDQLSNQVLQRKLKNYFSKTLDTNLDGIINWTDFQAAIDKTVSEADAKANARLKIVRMRLEQNYKKYFWDLCEVGDANKDGNIDLDEWLDVMNDIIAHLKENNKFPEWYEGLHKSLYRANEFYDDRNVLREEFMDMMLTWELDEVAAGKAYDFITENGKKKMDYELFSEFMKKFFTIDEQNHPINMGLDR